ncbi:hypothetical protein BHE74_00025847 [Ensete ventricosum]|nr:hypothetical protein GW17_00027067 [Ensete ventricosum]RWW66774.1 hypothetical protein BHE74_00025847 [Ensete ventricosum]
MNAGLQDPAFVGTGTIIGCLRCVLCKLWNRFPDVWEKGPLRLFVPSLSFLTRVCSLLAGFI